MPEYFAILTCRNSEAMIQKALQMVYEQTVQPQYVIVVDDGSTDCTGRILETLKEKYDTMHVITNPDLGHDTTRVVFNWNKALQHAESKSLPETDFHLIATDDIILEQNYVEKLLAQLQDGKLAIVSGTYLTGIEIESPHGAGRMVRNSFFNNTRWKGRYPEKMGYESAIVYEAYFRGYKCKVLADAHFEHIRRIGKHHRFRTFGASMKTLGYDPLFILGRVITYLVRGTPIGRIGTMQMLLSYITAKTQRTGFNSPFDDELRSFIRSQQAKTLKAIWFKRIKKKLFGF